MLSRIIYAARISLTVGLTGLSCRWIGVTIGDFSLFGGFIDLIIQRLIEIINSIPDLPLLMALAALVPPVLMPFGFT
jgi:peptide/nickel transport system permease protein